MSLLLAAGDGPPIAFVVVVLRSLQLAVAFRVVAEVPQPVASAVLAPAFEDAEPEGPLAAALLACGALPAASVPLRVFVDEDEPAILR